MKTYIVKIYEQPREYEVEAEDKADAEAKVMQGYNGSNYQDIYKIKIIKA